MGRTKQATGQSAKTKSGKAAFMSKVAKSVGDEVTTSEDMVKRKHRWKSGTVALRDIKKYQKSTKTLVPKAAVGRLMREIITEVSGSGDKRMSKTAIQALHVAVEARMVELYSDAVRVMVHAKRKKIFPQDLRIARALGKDPVLETSGDTYKQARAREKALRKK